MKVIITSIAALLVLNVFAQEKELLIIGTMHTVPSVVTHSYKPLLNYAKKYRPEAIFVEDIRPEDTLSLKNFTPRFLNLADSVAQVDVINEQQFLNLRTKQLFDMDSADFSFLANAYLQKRDRANYTYYNFLKLYGIVGSKKTMRRENEDLIFPLAISMGITELLPVDDHQTEPEYQRAWENAMEAVKESDNLMLVKLIKKDTRKCIWPAMWGNLGKYTNKQETLQRYYEINSCRYVTDSNEYSQAVQQLWDGRNLRIAENIAEQLKNSSYQKSVLIIGAGHVISVRDALSQVYPELKVKLMYD